MISRWRGSSSRNGSIGCWSRSVATDWLTCGLEHPRKQQETTMNPVPSAIAALALAVAASQPAAAQHRHDGASQHPGASTSVSPYAGQQRRSVKALSEQQLSDLQAGRGMGLALPAELNGYPGPSHVLELAD